MKIIYKQGNLVNATEPMIAHGCNNKGVMGAGVALAIKKKFPNAFNRYKEAYDSLDHDLGLGTVILVNNKGKIIANCITQSGYGTETKRYVDYGALRNCFSYLNSVARLSKLSVKDQWYYNLGVTFSNEIDAVAMPMIGAGLGGGNWSVISKIIEEHFSDVQPVVYYL